MIDNNNNRETVGRVLSIVGSGLVLAGAVVAPNLLLAVAPLLARKGKIDRGTTYRVLRYAHRQRWLAVHETSAGITVTLTKQGKRHCQFVDLSQPLKDAKWDGKWRLVLFDIPHKVKRKRDSLRYMLRQLGFVQLQKSVWITPYRCHEQIEGLKQLVGLRYGVQLVTATELEREIEIKRKFNL